LGTVERNLFSTKFILWDFGIEEKYLNKIPNFLIPLRRKLVIRMSYFMEDFLSGRNFLFDPNSFPRAQRIHFHNIRLP